MTATALAENAGLDDTTWADAQGLRGTGADEQLLVVHPQIRSSRRHAFRPAKAERQDETAGAPQPYMADTDRQQTPSAPSPEFPAIRVVGLKKWEGRVVSIEDGILTTELLPLDHQGPTLFADFDLELLAPDEDSVRPGDVVYFTVRTVRGKGRQNTATSPLRLKRLGQWTREELEAAQMRAREKARMLAAHAE